MSSLLETLKAKKMFWQMSFSGAVSVGEAYRGDLILVEGKVNASGNQNPPEVMVNQTLMTITDGKINFLTGYIHHLSDLNYFVEHYLPFCKEGMPFYFFVEDIKDEMSIELNGHTFYVFPLDEGTVWNVFSDLLGLEKSDFKGLSAGEKIVKVAEEAVDFDPKSEAAALDVALTRTFEVRKEARGPV